MFGVVPKKLWHKLNPPDEDNMCTWAMRCLLIEDGNRKILIDTGIGDKQDDKFRSHFSPHGSDSLDLSLSAHGYSREDITDVLITHMHFDHVGGAVHREGDRLVPTFPNATYWTNEAHLAWALDPNPREAASFLKENIQPLIDHGVLKMIDVESMVPFTDKIKIDFAYGHTEAMMIPHISLNNGQTLVYTADLLPSHCHVRMPYVMSYDIRPLVTLQEKAALYERLTQEDHYVFLEHDKDYECGKVVRDHRGRVVWEQAYALSEVVS